MGANILKRRAGFHKFSGYVRPRCRTWFNQIDRVSKAVFPFRKRIIYTGGLFLNVLFLFAPCACREAEERRGVATGDESLLREERDRAGSEAGAEEQRSLAGLAAECARRTASEIAAEMHRQFVRLPYAADVAVAVATDSHDAALLLGLVSRTGQT